MNAQNASQPSRLRLADIPKSRFCMWLFLSTEVMFFVALIGSYVVLRYGVPRTDWPHPSVVGVVPWIGGVNTVLLLLSSFFISRAVGASRRDSADAAKRNLIVALLLGLGFLGIKSFEYWEKFQLGLFPRPPATLVYSRYDTDYLAAVQNEIAVLRRETQRQRQRQPSTTLDRQVELYDALALGFVAWAGREYGQSDNPKQREMAIRTVGHLIRPAPDSAAAIENHLRNERTRLDSEFAELEGTKQGLQLELEQTTSQLNGLPSQPPDSQRGELEQRLANQRAELTALNNRWSVVADRLKFLTTIADTTHGINERYGIRLPIVVPGGRTWLYGYYLLTGIHALHLLAGVLAALALVPLTLGPSRHVLLGNVALYWNFVDCVWLVLFPIIYLT